VSWFVAAKGKLYRFATILPVFTAMYQLAIYVLVLIKSSYNDIKLKLWLSFIGTIALIVFYFVKNEKE